MKKKLKTRIPIWSMYVLLAVLLCLELFIGRYHIGIAEMAGILTGNMPVMESRKVLNILINIRLPRVLGAVLVGSALSAAGASYQGIFKNPMVSPSLLGVSSGAGFGAALGIILKLSNPGIQTLALLFGILAVFAVYTVGSIVSRNNNRTLSFVLLGIVVSSLFSSLISFVKYVGDPLDDLPAITFWLMGSLSSIMLKDIAFIVLPVIVGLAGLFIIKWRLNIMSFSDEEALSMGVSINNIRLITVICATLITASAVSVSGTIGWVGLVIPHLARFIVGNDYKRVIPASIAMGAIYMLAIDGISRCVFTVEMPLGILTSLIGTPVFITIMMKSKKNL